MHFKKMCGYLLWIIVVFVAIMKQFSPSTTQNIYKQQMIQKLEYQPLDTSVVNIQEIHKTYLFGLEGVTALRGVSLKIQQGEFVTILGNSGGGKTSLLNAIGTLDKVTKGNLQLYGEKIKGSTPDNVLSALRLNYLGFVFQTFNLISSLTALENVELPMILKGELSRVESQQRAESLLKSVGMGHRLTHYPNQLSGGEQQRVTIARALANRPKMLLLDEPTGDLDSRNTKNVLDILINLNQTQNITLIMVTHDANLKFYGHRVLKVLDGKIIGEEIIDRQSRMQYIDKLRKSLETVHNTQHDEQHPDNSVRKVNTYRTVKWLRQKKIREQMESEIEKRVSREIQKYN